MKASLPKSIWDHGFVPLSILSLYCFSFFFLFTSRFPEDARTVNTVFANRAGIISLFLAAAALLIYLSVMKLSPGSGLSLIRKREKLLAADFLLLLLPLAPVVQYVINNRDILSTGAALQVITTFLIFSLVVVIVLPAALSILASRKTLMITGMTFAFMVTNMAALSARFRWFQAGSLRIQLIVLAAVFIAARVLYRSAAGRKFLYSFVAIFFLSNTFIHLAAPGSTGVAPVGDDSENRLMEIAGTEIPLFTPNIYFLVYDAYVINETMLEYGLDNRDQEEYLESLGFTIYPHTYTVGEYTIPTISRTLEVSAEYYGSPRRGVSGDGVVQNLLKNFGYRTYGIFQSDRFFQGIGSSYDFYFPAVNTRASVRLLIKAILMGEFRFDVAFDRPSREEFVESKMGVFRDISPQPRFVYMHDYLPGHSQISGRCLPDETDLFWERLIEANHQMRLDLEKILQGDPGAIIIVAGDHGPYLTKNCSATGPDYHISEISRLDIQDRFGAFLAIRWPEENFSEYDDIVVLQDIFPAIFGYIFRDRGFLQARIEARTLAPDFISGAEVVDGIIRGGINDGEPLFLGP